jgi:hypothetical protein
MIIIINIYHPNSFSAFTSMSGSNVLLISQARFSRLCIPAIPANPASLRNVLLFTVVPENIH